MLVFAVSFIVSLLVSLTEQTTAQTTATTTLSPGCNSVSRVNGAQSSSGGTCNVTDNVLRIQCQTGACQAYNWSLNSCNNACSSGTSNGPTNSSSYICSDCSSASTAQGCSPPVSITPYYCGTTTTSTTTTSSTTTSTSTSSTTTSTTTTTSSSSSTSTSVSTSTSTIPTSTSTSTSSTTARPTSSTTTTTTTPTTSTSSSSTPTTRSTLTSATSSITSSITSNSSPQSSTITTSNSSSSGAGSTSSTSLSTTSSSTSSMPAPTTSASTSKTPTTQTTTSTSSTTSTTSTRPTTPSSNAISSSTPRPTMTATSATSTPVPSKTSTSTTIPTTSTKQTSSTSAPKVTSGSSGISGAATSTTTSSTSRSASLASSTFAASSSISTTTSKPASVASSVPTTASSTPKPTLVTASSMSAMSRPLSTAGPTTLSGSSSSTSKPTSNTSGTSAKIATPLSASSSTATARSTMPHSSAAATASTVTVAKIGSSSPLAPTSASGTFSTPTPTGSTKTVTGAPATTRTSTPPKPAVSASESGSSAGYSASFTNITSPVSTSPHSNPPSSSVATGSPSTPVTRTSVTVAGPRNATTPAVSGSTLAPATSGATSGSSTRISTSSGITSTRTSQSTSSGIPATQTIPTTACAGVTASMMKSTVQPAKNCAVCQGCTCPDGFLGDGYDCVIDPCATMTCGPNEYCEAAWSKSSCRFSLSFMCKCDPAMGCDTGCMTAVGSFAGISGYISRKHTITESVPSTSTRSRSTTSGSRPLTTPPCYNRTVLDAIVIGGCGQNDNQTRIQCADGTCVLFEQVYMDCNRDCSDGIDELCPPGYVTCDGCTCVLPSEVGTACQDLSSVYMARPCQMTGTSPTSTTTTTTTPAPVITPVRPQPTVQPAKSCVVCHGPNCSCPQGYLGDGIDCVVDQCPSIKCAWNEYCQGSWYKSATCQFSSSFTCLCDPEIGLCGSEQPQSPMSGHVSKKHTETSSQPGSSSSPTAAAPTTQGVKATTPLVLKEKCYSKNVVDTIVTGGCGNVDNTTRIQCSDGACVPFEFAYMNCKKDCPDGIDEQCPPGFIECDGCVCVSADEVFTTCTNLSSATRVVLCPPPVPAKNCTVCHGPNCTCPPGNLGDGIDCAVDQCGTTMKCAWNEICQANWYKSATCQFTTSFSCYCDPDIGCNAVTLSGATGGVSGYVSKRPSVTTADIRSTVPTVAPITTTTTVTKSSEASRAKLTTSSPYATRPTRTMMSSTTLPVVTTPPCRSILDAVVTGGCEHNDNLTRIRCGDGTCVPFDTAYMNCKKDCPDGIDEQCAPGFVKCDGCTCVDPKEVAFACSDPTSVQNTCGNSVSIPPAQPQPSPSPPSYATAALITRSVPTKNCSVCDEPNCKCPTGQIGDGIDCAVDECYGMTCKWSEYCQAFWYKTADCQFSMSFMCVCDPTVGCGPNPAPAPTPAVPHTRPTAPPSDSCTVCHGPNCTCPAGSIGDGISCVVDKCLTMSCAWNEICEGYWYKSEKCEFQSAFRCVCDQSVGCNQTTASPPSPEPVVCKFDQFLCRTGHRKCIPCAWAEDSVRDCDNGEDEVVGATAQSTCPLPPVAHVAQYAASGVVTHKPTSSQPGPSVTRSSCGANYFTCLSDGACIPCAWVNDGVRDCSNGEDEVSSAASFCAGVVAAPKLPPTVAPDPCRSGGITCPPNSNCVRKIDGTYVCVCASNYYQENQQCILHPCFDKTKSSSCDPHAWCDAGNSTTLSSFFQCHCMLPYVGDGRTCQLSTASEPPVCNATMFRCPSDGSCIPMSWVLDHVRDCPNGDDEQPQLIDECKIKKALCDSRAVCTNIPDGGYNCTCQLPFYGNGFSCWLPVGAPQPPNDKSDGKKSAEGAYKHFEPHGRRRKRESWSGG